MNKLKNCIFLLVLCSLFFVSDTVYASKCEDYSSKCTKESYGYSENGTSKNFTISLGVVHFNDINPAGGSKEQYVISYDDCGACTNDSSACAKYCSVEKYHFDTDSNNVSIQVDSTTKKFPIAICAIPYINSNPLNQPLTDSNARDYIYFSSSEVESAISNGKCTRDNVFYSVKAAQGSTGNKADKCEDKKAIYSFFVQTNMTDANITTNYYKTGATAICSVKVEKNGQNVTYNYSISANSSFACTASSFATSCYNTAGMGQNHACTLYTCSNNENGSITSTGKGVGRTCTLKNVLNSGDTIEFSYTSEKTVYENGSMHFNSIKKNGSITTDPVQIGNEEYAASKTCPSFVYYIKDYDSKNKWVVLSSNEIKDMYENENPDIQIITRYSLENASDMGELQPEDVVGSDEFFGKIDFGDPVDPTCQGLLGEDLLNDISDVLTYIRIAVPILVIVLGSVDLAKVILTDDPQEMKKAWGRFAKRCVIAIAIFFVPTIIMYLLNFIDKIADVSCDIRFF